MVTMAEFSSFLLFFTILILNSGVQFGSAGTIHKAANGVSICYWGSWSTYRVGVANFEVSNIDPTLCTHVVYAYTGLVNGVIASLDEYNDYQENSGKGNMKKFVDFANKNDLIALVGMGGWNEGSTKYSQMASTAAGRKAFVDSAVAYIKRFGFQGLQFDWMYPTQRGGVPADRENFVTLLEELKEAFEAEGLILSAGVGAANNVVKDAYDFANIAKHVEFIVSMTYDYHTYSDGLTGVSAPLKASDNISVEYSVNQWLDAGVAAEKIVITIPAYGRTSRLSDPSKHGLEAAVSGPGTAGQYTQEPGLLAYFEHCANLNWVAVHSDDSSYVYAYHDAEWINYDDADTISAKAQFVQEKGLGGVMIYSLESEDFEGNCGYAYPLLTAINEGLGRL